MAADESAPPADASRARASGPYRGALAGAVAAALLLRVLAARAKVLWFDEFLSANLIRHSWRELLPAVRREAHPPLYFALLKVWCGFFGDGPLGLKSLSIAAGTGAIFVVAGAVRRAKGEMAALAAALLMALSTVQIDQASDAKPYAVLAFFLALVLAVTGRMRDEASPASFAAALAAGAACASVHFYGGAAALAIALAAVWTARDRDGRLRAVALSGTVLLASCAWLPAALALPSGASDYIRDMWGRVPWWSPLVASTRVSLPGWRKPYPPMAGTMLPLLEPREWAGALVVLAIGALGLVAIRRRRRGGDGDGGRATFLVLCSLALWPGFLALESALAAVGRPIALVGRSEVVAEMGLAILVGIAVAKWKRGAPAVLALLAAIGLWTVVPQWRPQRGPRPLRWEDAIVRRLEAIVPPGAAVDVVTLGLGRPPFDYYARRDPRIRLVSFPASQDDHPGWTAHTVGAAEAAALAREAESLVARIDGDLGRGIPVYVVDRGDPRNVYLFRALRREHDVERVPWGASWFYRVIRAPLLDAGTRGRYAPLYDLGESAPGSTDVPQYAFFRG